MGDASAKAWASATDARRAQHAERPELREAASRRVASDRATCSGRVVSERRACLGSGAFGRTVDAISGGRRKLGCVTQHRAHYTLQRIGLQRQQRHFRTANLTSSRYDDRRETVDSATAIAIMMIVMRYSRNGQRRARAASGLERQHTGRKLVLVDQCSVVGAPDVRSEEQMARPPDIAKEGEHCERRDDRVTRSPEARLSSEATTVRLHGGLSRIFAADAVGQSTQMQPDCRIIAILRAAARESWCADDKQVAWRRCALDH